MADTELRDIELRLERMHNALARQEEELSASTERYNDIMIEIVKIQVMMDNHFNKDSRERYNDQ